MMIRFHLPNLLLLMPGLWIPGLDWTVGRRGIPYFDWGIEPGQDWVPRDPEDYGTYVAKKK